MLFQDLPLSEEIKKGISALEHQTPTQIQESVIPEILRRNDVLAGAPTGTGKTGSFAIPLLQLLNKMKGKTNKSELSLLIISPTRELAVQLEKDFAAYAKFTALKTGLVFGGTSLNPQIEILKNGLDILVATPGRLLDLRKQGYIDLEKIEILVLDEADLLLDMGFIDEIRKIIRLSPNLEQRLMFSATLPLKVEDLAKTFLQNPVRIQIDKNSSEKGIQPLLYHVSKPDKTELLLFVMRNIIKDQSVLIFRRTKFGVEKTAQALTKNGFSSSILHGDKSQSERSLALNDFRKNNVKILVATDVAARGLDITGLDFVLNFDIPNVPETYVHRIGRTARAGKSGTAISFGSASEREFIKNIEKTIGQKLPVAEENPYQQDKEAKAPVHKKKGSKHKKGRKGSGSKAKKKRWY